MAGRPRSSSPRAACKAGGGRRGRPGHRAGQPRRWGRPDRASPEGAGAWKTSGRSTRRSSHGRWPRSTLPVVSAIGHEVNVTLADHAADFRASPRAGRRRHVPDAREARQAWTPRRRSNRTPRTGWPGPGPARRALPVPSIALRRQGRGPSEPPGPGRGQARGAQPARRPRPGLVAAPSNCGGGTPDAVFGRRGTTRTNHRHHLRRRPVCQSRGSEPVKSILRSRMR